MARTVGIGHQNFGKLIKKNLFYIDKTKFIKEWWESEDEVTLITRPRRFGKTLTMSMVEQFFSVKYAEDRYIFEKLSIWEEEKYHELQGRFPVISLTFSAIKGGDFKSTIYQMGQILSDLYSQYSFLLASDVLLDEEKIYFRKIVAATEGTEASMAVFRLSSFLSKYYGKKVIILLDEYDTPMQEAYLNGYWDEMVAFTRNMFNSAFKANPYLERAIITGITRISKEFIFSDLNNLKVITVMSEKYADIFGFTEDEVFCAMDEMGLKNKNEVKSWYDGFTFGDVTDIYNPWSIINLLDSGQLKPYWVNTSGNGLINNLIKNGTLGIKEKFRDLMEKKAIYCKIDEEIVFSQLDYEEDAIWSLFLASGYLKVMGIIDGEYELVVTNYEVLQMFKKMVKGWFKRSSSNYNEFLKSMLNDDVEGMNGYMSRVTNAVFSYFDTGGEPEKFYHGFVLGLIVEFEGRYHIRSNHESGFGRFDIMMEPIAKEDNAIIIEFKVFNSKKEKSLEDTAKAALKQIKDKNYEQELLSRGIEKDRIHKYGFAFEGSNVLIDE